MKLTRDEYNLIEEHFKKKWAMLKEIGNYYVDKNGNKFSKSKYSADRALEASRTLKNCKDCENCENCFDCTSCKDCKNCLGCENCESCVGCEDCKGCKYCLDCKRCENCIGCNGVRLMKNVEAAKIVNYLRRQNR